MSQMLTFLFNDSILIHTLPPDTAIMAVLYHACVIHGFGSRVQICKNAAN